MRPVVRVLYLLRPGESQPPAHLSQAASVHMLPAGTPPDGSTRNFSPQIICVHSPFDHDARIALDAVDDLDIPVIGIGTGNMDGLAMHVSEAIPPEDLRSMLELLVSVTDVRAVSSFVCHAENAGQCMGRVVDDLVRLLEHLLSERFPDYRERAERVSEASFWIASHLCLPPAELKDVLRAARLREVGKLSLPDRIVLARRHERSPEEQASYDRYPELGARALRELPTFRSTAQIVEFQLENFDGSGPASLMAHQIPLGSRVLRVAAAFAGITVSGDNRQRAAQEAIAILEKGRGSLFDPLLVKLVENFHQTRKESAQPSATRLIRLTDLAEGMVLAEDVWSRTGMKILPNGTRLTAHILKIVRQFPLDPALESVQVLR
jgi:HD-GYP domain-containing protein (c-di-GMP phosphodiesterase class II)